MRFHYQLVEEQFHWGKVHSYYCTYDRGKENHRRWQMNGENKREGEKERRLKKGREGREC